MEIIILLLIVGWIYSKGKSAGFDEGNKKGSQAGYQAGLLEGASKVSVKDGGGDGCIVLLFTISSLMTIIFILISTII